MKKWILSISLIVIMMWSAPAGGSLNVQLAGFSNTLDVGAEYTWNIDNYQVGNQRVEYKSSPTSFELVHGSDVDLTVVKDPSELNLATNSSLTNATYLSEYFDLSYDDISYNFDKADQLFIWIFPSRVTSTDGSTIDIYTEFWIYNLHNLLKNGETLEFNSTLPENGHVSSSTSDGEKTVTLNFPESSIQARFAENSGIMNTINFVSDTPDFRIEIDRRGGGGGALPISPFWSIIPLIALPILYRKLRN